MVGLDEQKANVKTKISETRLLVGELLINDEFIKTYKESYINNYHELYRNLVSLEKCIK